MDNIVAQIFLQTATATAFAKPLTDMVKKSPIPTPSWLLPIIAVVFGIGVCFCLSLILGNSLDGKTIGSDILAGAMAGVAAVGVTELQKSAG